MVEARALRSVFGFVAASVREEIDRRLVGGAPDPRFDPFLDHVLDFADVLEGPETVSSERESARAALDACTATAGCTADVHLSTCPKKGRT